MTYIELINNFWKLNKEKAISTVETMLYFKLLDTCNSLGWKNVFSHSNGFICGEISVSEKTMIRARCNLKKYGLITYKSGKQKRQITEYKIVGVVDNWKNSTLSDNLSGAQSDSLSDSQNGNLNGSLSGTQSGTQSGEKSPDNIRKRKDKDKDKEKKDKEESKDSLSSGDDGQDSVKYIFDQFNLICKNIVPVKLLTKRRRENIGARLRDHGFENVMKMMEMASRSDFLAGANHKQWMATIDWMFRPNNFVKVLEGNYNNKPERHSADSYNARPSHLEIIEETYYNLFPNEGSDNCK